MSDLDMINHPTHYTCREHECIDEMIAVFGVIDTIAFCKLNCKRKCGYCRDQRSRDGKD